MLKSAARSCAGNADAVPEETGDLGKISANLSIMCASKVSDGSGALASTDKRREEKSKEARSSPNRAISCSVPCISIQRVSARSKPLNDASEGMHRSTSVLSSKSKSTT
eukprot:CAMPEP_0177595744 /NCGR_PEP_ID=MMETSP0419_2-20121207/10553_1 /TAXON_ID=582737 /ORGANISM="Tetraselmis sp., Strain GSL018" /LENGTH=108 /DNA_ID=CAMNT_0019087291 /DNA_START=505 /DNA_END=831 /DNA_ORIENTATION=+